MKHRILILVLVLALVCLPLTSFAAPDTSKEVKLTMYLLGDTPQDLDIVYTELNKQLKEKINATLSTVYLSWGDWNTKYSLVLASGDDVDMIFTSDWAYYTTEAAKGAFYELTDDFLNTYMPQTMISEDPFAIKQATLSGQVFSMPKNLVGLEGEGWVVIRQDLADKYGITVTDLASLEEYFAAVKANETGILPNAASARGGFEGIVYTQPNKSIVLTGLEYDYFYTDGSAPDFSAIEYMYFRPEMVATYDLMRKWEEAGFWSKNAISNTEQVRDAFENGKSASLTWNATIFDAGRNLVKNNPEWVPGYIDINPGTPRRISNYTNDCIAIAATSRNPERAAMFIDLVKNDLDVYMALVGGIEGTHYILDKENNTRSPGPDASRYPWNPSTWCFNLKTGTGPVDAGADPVRLAFEAEQEKLIVKPATAAFRFTADPVKSELAALNALRDEYRPMLELGMTADPAATVAEWKTKAEAAGLNTVNAELQKQYEEWKATL